MHVVDVKAGDGFAFRIRCNRFHIGDNGNGNDTSDMAFGAELLCCRRVPFIALAKYFDDRKPALTIPFHDYQIVIRHGGNHLAARRFIMYFGNTSHADGRDDHNITRTRFTMAVRIFSRIIDIEVRMSMMLDGANVQAPRNKLRNHLYDKRGFPGIMPPHKRNCRTRLVKSRYHSSPFIDLRSAARRTRLLANHSANRRLSFRDRFGNRAHNAPMQPQAAPGGTDASRRNKRRLAPKHCYAE